MTSEFGKILVDEASRAGFDLTSSQVHLAERHAVLLLDWNRRVNLTRITELRALARRHFVEAFIAARLMPTASSGHSVRVLDVGSGAGFPGLAARVVRPDLDVTLLEPRAKKAAFLSHATALYPAPRTQVLVRRLEDVQPVTPWDVACYRAVRVPVAQLERVLRDEGCIINFLPAGEPQPELAEAGLVCRSWETLHDGRGCVACWTRHRTSPD